MRDELGEERDGSAADDDRPVVDSDRLLVRPYIRPAPDDEPYQLPERGDATAADRAGAAGASGAAGGGGDAAAATPAWDDPDAADAPAWDDRDAADAPAWDDGDAADAPAWDDRAAADAPAGDDRAAAAVIPPGGDPPTAPLPRVPPPGRHPDPALDDRDRRQVLWLVGVGIAIALAAVAGLIVLWPRGDEEPPAADSPTVAGVPAPEAGAPASATPGAAPSPPGRPATSTPGATRSSRPAGATTTAPPAGAPAGPTRPAAPPPTTTAAPDPTLAAPPATDRVGPVTAAGGRCLDVAGGIVFPGSSLAVSNCNGTLSQRWTLATDGTLRVGGSCATADGADDVEVAGCGDATAAQWRAGPGGTLVSVDSGRCLTDPADGSRNGAELRLAACGAAGQRWTLP